MTKLGKLIALKKETVELADSIEQEIREKFDRTIIVTYHDHYDEPRFSIWDHDKDTTSEAAYFIMTNDPYWDSFGKFTRDELDIMEGVFNGTV